MASRPHPLLALLEMRAPTELGAFALTAPAMAGLLPRGDNRTVLILPGFMTGDGSTRPLRTLLSTLGYNTHGWGLGRNLGPTAHIVEGIAALLERLHRDNGPVDIVGWSLGGLFARELARLDPKAVNQVITLGSPFQTLGPNRSNASVAFAALRHRHTDMVDNRQPSWNREPIPVPSTSIYTKTDGVVNWHECLNRDFPHVENIEVYGSHCGLGFNPSATFVIADRLTQTQEEWQPFQAPFALKALYPSAANFDTRLAAAA